MYSVFTPTFFNQSRTALAVNSTPLSERMRSGTPRVLVNHHYDNTEHSGTRYQDAQSRIGPFSESNSPNDNV